MKKFKGKRPPQKTGKSTNVLYGINSVESALLTRKRELEQVYLKDGRLSGRLDEIRQLAEKAGIGIAYQSNDGLEKTCGSANHQGSALRCGPLPYKNETECLALQGASRRPLLLALDEVQDPMNLGAIARSGAAFGIDGLILPRHHSSPLSPAASRASAGFLESLPIFEVANLARFLSSARKQGFWVAGSTLEGGQPLNSFQNDQPLILVMGSEGKGLRPLVEKSCDFLLTIHTRGKGGLNVSAASAVFLHHLTRHPAK